MEVVRGRMTKRAFAPGDIPREHFEMILEAARHAPSGANAQPLLGVPEPLSIIDVMCFGPPLKPSYERWKKRLDQIVSWDRFNPDNVMTDEQIDEWVKTTRHKVMYRDETRVD
jgi:hypothetical protein